MIVSFDLNGDWLSVTRHKTAFHAHVRREEVEGRVTHAIIEVTPEWRSITMWASDAATGSRLNALLAEVKEQLEFYLDGHHVDGTVEPPTDDAVFEAIEDYLTEMQEED